MKASLILILGFGLLGPGLASADDFQNEVVNKVVADHQAESGNMPKNQHEAKANSSRNKSRSVAVAPKKPDARGNHHRHDFHAPISIPTQSH